MYLFSEKVLTLNFKTLLISHYYSEQKLCESPKIITVSIKPTGGPTAGLQHCNNRKFAGLLITC